MQANCKFAAHLQASAATDAIAGINDSRRENGRMQSASSGEQRSVRYKPDNSLYITSAGIYAADAPQKELCLARSHASPDHK